MTDGMETSYSRLDEILEVTKREKENG